MQDPRSPPEAGDTTVTPLPNGARVVTLRLPHLATASVSIFVRSGSQHESRRLNGISHFAEHMAFKGTLERDCQRINLDAERLGAEVNAHTDKDHTAYHMAGRAEHAERFLQMLADIVLQGSYPEAELEREREVILQEYLEDEDDALATAFKLFDKSCYGEHAIAQPVIGTRRNIERFSRDELLGYVQRQYTAANLVVGVAGNIDPERIVRAAQALFGAMPAGTANLVEAPAYAGGWKTRRMAGSGQSHVVLGYPIPTARQDYVPAMVAAALFGEGMSSPLLDQIRERRGLVYYAACSADVMELSGQFVIEASTTPEHLDEFFVEAMRLLAEHTERIDPVGLERARNQIAVRSLRAQERPSRRLEAAALDLFIHGRVRAPEELMARVDAVSADQVRGAFAQMLAAPAAVAVAGKLGKGSAERVQALVAAPLSSLGAGVPAARELPAPAG
ncbi:MAG TPA: pitrilysin family protein [Ideonella sp.]|nr:pitrilysin family protein [Ideonella sp.]